MKRVSIICLTFLIILSCAIIKKPAKEDTVAKLSDTANQKVTKDDTGAEPSDANKENKVVVSEFILGIGDEIEIKVYRHDDLNRRITIPPEGKNTLPLIGEIQTKGVSVYQINEKIKEALSNYLVNPEVSVEVTSFKGQKIFVLGEVNRPGVYQIDPPTTVLEAISNAGGFTLDGKGSSVLLIRGGPEKPDVRTLDLKKALEKGKVSQNILLQTGDVVYVPRTLIAHVDRFFQHFENIIRPIIWSEQGIVLAPRVEDVFQGESSADKGSSNVPIVIQK